MTTTADMRDYLSKQMQHLAGLADLDPAREKDRAQIHAAVEVAKASALIAGQFTSLAKVEIDAARALTEYGVTTASVRLESTQKQGLERR